MQSFWQQIKQAKMLWLVLALIVLIQAWWVHQHLQQFRTEVAQRLRLDNELGRQTQQTVINLQGRLKNLEAQTTLLESKQMEAQNQQIALEQLYQNLLNSRDEWTLAEIEHILIIASQQLQITGQVSIALTALEGIDQRLASPEKSQFITIRRALAHDIARLRALPVVDMTGIALQIEVLQGGIGNLPLLADVRTVSTSESGYDAKKSTSRASQKWTVKTQQTLATWWGRFMTETRDLIRVHRAQAPEALLLTPEQSYYIQENLRLRLTSARIALLSRNEALFRHDLNIASDMIQKYFDIFI